MRKILGCIKRAQQDFHMIEEGDIVAVGLSGGKDSMTLLYALNLYRRFSPVNYTLKGITVDMGFPGFDMEKIQSFCEAQDAEFIPLKTRIGELIFEEKQEKNPCGLCSRMRRGLLNRVCDEKGITRLALGHHGDDLLETFFMSMVFESRLNTFRPVTAFERASVIQIRPLIYACESDLQAAAARHAVPAVENPCPASGFTQRQSMKAFIAALEQSTGQPRTHMIRALCSDFLNT